MHIGVIGNGFVGKAMIECFKKHHNITIYDKHQKEYNQLTPILTSTLCFVAVPTPASKEGYDLDAIHDVMTNLADNKYNGIVIIKSTVLPGCCRKLIDQYQLKIVHNPEFLSESTAVIDFANQKHIVIGAETTEFCNQVARFYKPIFPEAVISLCNTVESESIKLFCNNFYAAKVQIFTEFYNICDFSGADYTKVVDMMLKNGWINSMHTKVPGTDGRISFGGACFPKDTTALVNFCDRMGITNEVLKAVINERNKMRLS